MHEVTIKVPFEEMDEHQSRSKRCPPKHDKLGKVCFLCASSEALFLLTSTEARHGCLSWACRKSRFCRGIYDGVSSSQRSLQRCNTVMSEVWEGKGAEV